MEPKPDDMDFFFFQAEDGIRDYKVTGVQTCALPILSFGAIVTRSFSSASQATAWRMKSVLPEKSRNALLAKSESPTSRTAGCRAFSSGLARATTKAARMSGPCVSFCGLKSRTVVILSEGVSARAQLRGLDLARGWNTHSLPLLSRKLTGREWGNMVKTWPRSREIGRASC